MQDGQGNTEQTTGPDLVIRRATVDDFSTIRHIHTSTVRALKDSLLSESEITEAARVIRSTGYLSELMQKTLHVALINGDIVGTGAWSPSNDRGVAARISAVFVAPLFQGQGVGRHLIGELERDAADNGYQRLTATVPVAVVAVFDALGYAVASHGVSRDAIPGTLLQVAFLRKPG